MEVVTLKEIEEWVGLKNRGKPLPENWKALLSSYINSKKRFADIHRKRLKSAEDDIDVAEGDYYLLTGVKFE